MSKTILFPLPDTDFDVTEVAVPWKLLTDAGHQVVFATEKGEQPRADPLLISGVILGKLGAFPEPIKFYTALEGAPEFASPASWHTLVPADFDALFLAGGHAPGMRQYLGSEELQEFIGKYWQLRRPVAAICHGVLLLARSSVAPGEQSVLHNRRTTCLPKYMERTAYWLTAWRRGRYYRTYPAYVEDEVRAALADATQFERGPRTLTKRGSLEDDSPCFTVRDDNYVSGRWPGDAYLIAKNLIALLGETDLDSAEG